MAGDSFEHFVPSTERGRSLFLFMCLFVLCTAQKVERRRDPPFEGAMRLSIFNPLMLFLACVWKVLLNCFNVTFVVTDAPVLVRFLCCDGATSLASQNLVKTKKLDGDPSHTLRPRGQHGVMGIAGGEGGVRPTAHQYWGQYWSPPLVTTKEVHFWAATRMSCGHATCFSLLARPLLCAFWCCHKFIPVEELSAGIGGLWQSLSSQLLARSEVLLVAFNFFCSPRLLHPSRVPHTDCQLPPKHWTDMLCGFRSLGKSCFACHGP